MRAECIHLDCIFTASRNFIISFEDRKRPCFSKGIERWTHISQGQPFYMYKKKSRQATIFHSGEGEKKEERKYEGD